MPVRDRRPIPADIGDHVQLSAACDRHLARGELQLAEPTEEPGKGLVVDRLVGHHEHAVGGERVAEPVVAVGTDIAEVDVAHRGAHRLMGVDDHGVGTRAR